MTLFEQQNKQPRRHPPRGRPPSYPAVVTTTTDDDDGGGGGGDGGDGNRPAPEAARGRRRRTTAAAASGVDDDDGGGDRGTAPPSGPSTAPPSRWHDRAVPGLLSSDARVDVVVDVGIDGPGGGTTTTLADILSSIILREEGGEEDGDYCGTPLAGRLDRLVGIHNLGLSRYASGYHAAALDAVLPPLSHLVVARRRGDDDSRAARDVASRIAFLALDCHLALHGGDSGLGLPPTMKGGGVEVDVDGLLAWIERGTDEDAASSAVDAHPSSSSPSSGQHVADELKFRLHLYRSRILFAVGRGGASSAAAGDEQRADDADGRTRAARKELKNAMDIYQNRLCVVAPPPAAAAAAAVADDDDGGGGDEETEEGGVGGGKDRNVRRGGGGGKGNSRQQQSGGGKGGGGGGKGKSPQDASETTSVTSMASDTFCGVEGKGGGGGGATSAAAVTATRATFEGMPSKTAAAAKTRRGDTADLRMRHESVLYLKANLEYLRGNTAKSLKLCAEARSAGRRGGGLVASGRDAGASAESTRDLDGGGGGPRRDDLPPSNDADLDPVGDDVEAPTDPDGGEARMAIDYGEALYYNNLALLHQTEGMVHLALRYYSYALYYIERAFGGCGEEERASPPPSPPLRRNFWSNGLARPDVTAEILYNASLCAFQAQEFHAAYSHMARCVGISPTVFGRRARCWLRLAQSCIGKACFICSRAYSCIMVELSHR